MASERLPIDLIVLDDRAWPRTARDKVRIAQFADLYAEQGPDALPPVDVVTDGEGGFIRADGEHRIRAARLAGLAEIPARVMEVPPGEDPITFAFVHAVKASARGAQQLTRAERKRGILRLLGETTLTDREIASLFGVSRQTVWRYRSDVADETGAAGPGDESPGDRYLSIVTAGELAERLFKAMEKVRDTRGLGVADALLGDRTADRLARILRDAYGKRALKRALTYREWLDRAIEELEEEEP